ncbi:hypothetical protein [Bacillus thuringiensis]|uniref:hypothetical protein n=1 Tax=Bacillus thuringiensis TaxID=1428 RepID=UPI0008C5FE84|nr:hypothetical protein [Bacillus thuringiensis]SEJ97142.1 hypothetical protein SAMN04487780_12916 [Bacillus thuringiensis]HDR8476439.1 hypothetical protein [Bacillus cereus]
MTGILDTFQNCSKEVSELLPIPTNAQLVSVQEEIRDGIKVEVRRYQTQDTIQFRGPHITTIASQEGRYPLSYTNLIAEPSGEFLNLDYAAGLAMDIMFAIDPEYAEGLTILRIEKQTRCFINSAKDIVEFPVLWIKMIHSNGSYNWVTLGSGGKVVEFERQVQWDYLAGRRQTEMWFHDEWVLTRMGKGPQLPPPIALA